MGYFDLGSHHCPVTTTSTQTQLWFDRSLIWLYGYDHEEAIRCFEHALIMTFADRYPDDPTIEDYNPWNNAIAAAMRLVQAAHPDDLDGRRPVCRGADEPDAVVGAVGS